MSEAIKEPETQKFYELDRDLSLRDGYVEDELPSNDTWLMNFPNINAYRKGEFDNFFYHFMQPQELHFPEGIEFMCIWEFLQIHDPNLTRVTDFPSVRESWPIMSKRMLAVLRSVGSFPHQSIPITMVSDEIYSDETSDDFVAVQLLEHLDIIDLEHSIYEDDEYLGLQFEHMVLKEPDEGFPPLFRLKQKPTLLYVSSKARWALESAEIKGIEFIFKRLSSR